MGRAGPYRKTDWEPEIERMYFCPPVAWSKCDLVRESRIHNTREGTIAAMGSSKREGERERRGEKREEIVAGKSHRSPSR